MARHLSYGKTHQQIREPLLAAAILAGGMSGPACGSPMSRHHLTDPHHTDAAGR